MPSILAFDPGKATGVALGVFDETHPYHLVKTWIIQGGARGLAAWLNRQGFKPDIVVSERFVPDGTAGGRETVSPQGEGVLIAYFDNIHWQLRSDKTWGMSSIEPVDAKLKELGLWVTGYDVDWKDGRDANDSLIHSLYYLRKIRHKPTLRWLSE